MRAVIVLSMVLGAATAFAQSGSGSAGSAAGSATDAAGAGKGSAAGDGAPAADPAPAPVPPAPAIDPAARRKICEAALVKPPGNDPRFVTDAESFALGQLATSQLAKTPEGQACVDAVVAFEDFRSLVSTAAREKAAVDLAAEVEQQHEKAAEAIKKNQKHVVLAYAALWILAVAFLLFLWRRQQHLKSEIAALKRDLDAASK